MSEPSPPAKRPGPEPKLVELAPLILDHLRNGAYLEVACRAVGIHPDTLDNWRKWGREGREPYAEFLADFDAARAAAEQSMVREIREGTDQWQRLAWLLERTRPDRYRSRQQTELTGKDGGPLEFRSVQDLIAGGGA